MYYENKIMKERDMFMTDKKRETHDNHVHKGKNTVKTVVEENSANNQEKQHDQIEHHDHEAHQHEEEHDANHDNHHAGHDHGEMVEDFKKRFFTSLIVTIPILALSPMIQG